MQLDAKSKEKKTNPVYLFCTFHSKRHEAIYFFTEIKVQNERKKPWEDW